MRPPTDSGSGMAEVVGTESRWPSPVSRDLGAAARALLNTAHRLAG
jgi:hypothetical protein